MALLKEITNSRGIVTNYHKISQFTLNADAGMLTVCVRHYADLEYRNAELSVINDRRLIASKQAELSSLCLSENNRADTVLNTGEILQIDEEPPVENEYRSQLEAELNDLISNLPRETSYFAYEDAETIEVDVNDSFSLEGIYNMLKENDSYAGAADELTVISNLKI